MIPKRELRGCDGAAITRNGKMEKVADAIRYTFVRPSNPEPKLVITLAGKLLLTNQLVQEFSSSEDAREHLDRVVKLRKKEGLVLQATEQISTRELERAVEEIDEDVRVTFTDGRWSAKFPGGAEKAAVVCVKLLARLKKDAPQCVTLLIDSQTPGAQWAKAIKGRQLSSVRAFVVDDHAQTQTRQAQNSIGDLAATLDAFPALERAFATGHLELTKCSHGVLSELYLLGDPIHESCLRALGESEFPALRRLVLSLASESAPAPQAAWQGALLSIDAPKLEEVYVYGVKDVATALETLLKTAIPASWRMLTVVGAIDDETRLLQVLSAHTGRLAALAALALPLADEISETGGQQARTLLSNLRDSGEQADLTLPATYRDW